MSQSITEWIIRVTVLLFAITIHEYAHGRVAFFLGDPTAKRAGRLTLNPISHIDPLGALCLFLFRFGWAKPVPVDIRYFKNPRTGSFLVSLSGPLANLFAAFVAGTIFRFFLFPSELYITLLVSLILMNIGLGIFNLLPVPPLDGSHILESVLPSGALQQYRELGKYAPMVLIGIFLADRFLQTGIISMILHQPMRYLLWVFSGLRLG
ncbi:MAG: site-2 protease family protein [Deltaproteobacteria bacterium]|nr:site-2 protease family protein [Deltaproteobacteria bacterium]